MRRMVEPYPLLALVGDGVCSSAIVSAQGLDSLDVWRPHGCSLELMGSLCGDNRVTSNGPELALSESRGGQPGSGCDPHDALADVVAGEEPHERARCSIETLDDVLEDGTGCRRRTGTTRGTWSRGYER